MATKATIFIDDITLDEADNVSLGLGPPQGKMKEILEKAKAAQPLEIKVNFSKPVQLQPEIESVLLEWMKGK